MTAIALILGLSKQSPRGAVRFGIGIGAACISVLAVGILTWTVIDATLANVDFQYDDLDVQDSRVALGSNLDIWLASVGGVAIISFCTLGAAYLRIFFAEPSMYADAECQTPPFETIVRLYMSGALSFDIGDEGVEASRVDDDASRAISAMHQIRTLQPFCGDEKPEVCKTNKKRRRGESLADESVTLVATMAFQQLVP